MGKFINNNSLFEMTKEEFYATKSKLGKKKIVLNPQTIFSFFNNVRELVSSTATARTAA
jgi:hypothetical protein